MHSPLACCEGNWVSSNPLTIILWRALSYICMIAACCVVIACAAKGTTVAQDIDTQRKGVVKIVATADGKSKTGTGFILKHGPDATYIMTASHVVEGDKFPKVEFFTLRNTLVEAEVLQNDTRNDISLLKVRDKTQLPLDIKVFPLTTSQVIKDNEELIAIGFPVGGGPWATVRVTLASRDGADLILDGNINEGNSGGPILKDGKIVGLLTSADTFGRAIPAKIVTTVLEGWGVTLAESNGGGKSSTVTQASRMDRGTSTSPAVKPQEETRLQFEPEMVRIPPGKFLMGSPKSEQGRGDDEGPQQEVTITYAFEIGKYEVTFDEYDAFAKATHRKLSDDRSWGRGRQPVFAVNFKDAQAYVRWLSEQTGKKYRLPTEAEWEYAARAGTTTAYWWGSDIGDNNAVCSGCGSQWNLEHTEPVGSFKPNAFGLYDTAGNVWEWTQDCWHDNYRNAPQDGSAWKEANSGYCIRRVIRGGSWCEGPRGLRSANRDGYYFSGAPFLCLGFRVARDF